MEQCLSADNDAATPSFHLFGTPRITIGDLLNGPCRSSDHSSFFDGDIDGKIPRRMPPHFRVFSLSREKGRIHRSALPPEFQALMFCEILVQRDELLLTSGLAARRP